jgi:hypothetical protein
LAPPPPQSCAHSGIFFHLAVTIYYLAFTEVLVEKVFRVAFGHNFNDSPFLSLNKYSLLIIPEEGSAHYAVS